MATNVMAGQTQALIEHDFSWIQKLILRRFHPRSIFRASSELSGNFPLRA